MAETVKRGSPAFWGLHCWLQCWLSIFITSQACCSTESSISGPVFLSEQEYQLSFLCVKKSIYEIRRTYTKHTQCAKKNSIFHHIETNCLILCRSSSCHQNGFDPSISGIYKISSGVLWYLVISCEVGHNGLDQFIQLIPHLPCLSSFKETGWLAPSELRDDASGGGVSLRVLLKNEGKLEQKADHCDIGSHATIILHCWGEEEAEPKGKSPSLPVDLC